MSKFSNLMTLRHDELVAAAKHFNINASEENTKREIVDQLREREIGVSDYIAVFGNRFEDDPSTDEDDETPNDAASAFERGEERVLVKMVRGNSSWSTAGFTFTRTHPFGIFPKSIAAEIVKEEGFRYASADEAEKYYS